MRTITQSHKRQQWPVMLDCWVFPSFEADPSFNLRTPRVMEVDNADERRKRNRGSRCRHVAAFEIIEDCAGSSG
jgi:hypothetical protein